MKPTSAWPCAWTAADAIACPREFAFSITCWSCSRGTAVSTWNSPRPAISTWTSTTRWRTPGSHSGRPSTRRLGDKRGIWRAGYFLMPMDETLGLAAVDFGGRSHAVVETKVRTRLVGDLQAELVHDFFDGFARGARANVHLKVMYGRSSHHKIEALFKAFAGRCAWPVRGTRGCGACCPAPRDCCDHHRRLQGGEPGFGAEGIRAPRVCDRDHQRSGRGGAGVAAGAAGSRKFLGHVGAGGVGRARRNRGGHRPRRAVPRNLRRHAMAVRGQRGSAGSLRPGRLFAAPARDFRRA